MSSSTTRSDPNAFLECQRTISYGTLFQTKSAPPTQSALRLVCQQRRWQRGCVHARMNLFGADGGLSQRLRLLRDCRCTATQRDSEGATSAVLSSDWHARCILRGTGTHVTTERRHKDTEERLRCTVRVAERINGGV